mgnify:CR=1 FL=1
MKCEVVTTRGGARAMLDHETGEVMHPVIGKVVRRTRKYHAHNEGNEAKAGDTVVIVECRPSACTARGRWR